MSHIVNFPARFAFVNSDGTLTMEAMRMLRGWFERIGDANGLSVADITVLLDAFAVEPAPVDCSSDMAAIADEFRQLPPQAIEQDDSQLQAPPFEQIASQEYLETQVREMAEQIAFLRNEIQELKQGTML